MGQITPALLIQSAGVDLITALFFVLSRAIREMAGVLRRRS
jgi:hypothetical protein